MEIDVQALPLSIAIITLNEERNLPRCLASVKDLAAEIVIVDAGSTDATAAIAGQYGARFETHPWQGHVAQKNTALRRCTKPWVLCLDADEAVSPELAEAVRKQFPTGEPAENGFLINRRTFYLGAWIWHAWYPEWRLRLVRREVAQWQGLDPHDRLEVEGATTRLKGDLFHYSYRNLTHHLEKTVSYARIGAEAYIHAGRRFHWYNLILSPPATMLKQLFLRGSLLDGWRGWLIAGMTAIKVFAKHAFLLERRLTGTVEETKS